MFENFKLYRFDVRLFMKSGAVLYGNVTKLEKTFRGDELTGLKWSGDMPFYLRLDDISAIETTQRYNWKGWFR